jgi:uncharacterized membrane protein
MHSSAGSSAVVGSNGGASGSCTTLTYANFGQKFVATYCAGCHGGSVTGAARQGAPLKDVFDTLAEVKSASRDMVREVVVKRTMPYGSATKPSDTERTQLGEWLGCGAP